MKIIYKNMEIKINENDRVIDVFKEKVEEDKNIIACMVNNEVKNLNYILKENDEVELLDTTSRDGARIYTRGLLFIMSMAFRELYPEILLSVNYQLKSSMLCELKDMEPTEEMIENVRKRMQEIIDANIPIKKTSGISRMSFLFPRVMRKLKGRLRKRLCARILIAGNPVPDPLAGGEIV